MPASQDNSRNLESPIPIQQTQSAFHPHAQLSVGRRKDRARIVSDCRMANDAAMMSSTKSCTPMHDAITVYTFWLVCFTAVLALATIILATFTIDLAFTSRRTAQRQLRAYVAVRAESVSSFAPDTPIGIRFRMTNHGQTPAYDVSQAATIAMLPHPLPPNFNFPAPPTPTPSRFVLHPGASFDAGVVTPRPYNAIEIVQVTTNNGFRIYLYGTVTYRDAFKKDRETTFCVSIVPSENLIALSRGRPLPSPVNIDFHAAEQHNEAT